MRRVIRVVVVGLALAAGPVVAQQRPDEDAMFGGEEEQQSTPPPVAPVPAPTEQTPPSGQPTGSAATNVGPPTDERDAAALGGEGIRDQFASEEAVEDPLRIGGQFYFRSVTSYAEGQQFKAVGFSAPSLVDLYLDARPTDRLRTFVSGRLTYDPAIDSEVTAGELLNPEGGVQNTDSLLTGSAPQNPRVLLDQAWIRFDLARTVFVTIGKQHVKWGTARFWNPTDFLSPERRNPLLVFDPRVGASMVKLHVPWEQRGWNFYAVGLLDNAGAGDSLGKIGGAARAEVVFGTTELGADAVFVLGRKPRYGLDVSSAVGPFDVYGEVAFRTSSDRRLWRTRENADPALGYFGEWEQYQTEGVRAAATGGLTYTFAYSDNDTATIGAEYHYNPYGYDDARVYPWLILNGDFQAFYLGQHYGAAYALLAGPGSWDDTSFAASTLLNVSDGSGLTRLDISQRVLTYLSVELFGQVHYGTRGGEFRFEVDQPATAFPTGEVLPAINVPAPVFSIGASVRLNL